MKLISHILVPDHDSPRLATTPSGALLATDHPESLAELHNPSDPDTLPRAIIDTVTPLQSTDHSIHFACPAQLPLIGMRLPSSPGPLGTAANPVPIFSPWTAAGLFARIDHANASSWYNADHSWITSPFAITWERTYRLFIPQGRFRAYISYTTPSDPESDSTDITYYNSNGVISQTTYDILQHQKVSLLINDIEVARRYPHDGDPRVVIPLPDAGTHDIHFLFSAESSYSKKGYSIFHDDGEIYHVAQDNRAVLNLELCLEFF